jgi:predicted RNA methylase
VLDIAAGHGLYAIAKAAPDAEIVAVDWDAVLTAAARNAAKSGIG